MIRKATYSISLRLAVAMLLLLFVHKTASPWFNPAVDAKGPSLITNSDADSEEKNSEVEKYSGTDGQPFATETLYRHCLAQRPFNCPYNLYIVNYTSAYFHQISTPPPDSETPSIA